MAHQIDPQFSVYNLVDWRNIYNIFTERRKLLAHWSKSIEESVIHQELDTSVYASFQQMRYIKPVLPRYHEMHNITKRIYVFGVPASIDPPLNGFESVHLRDEDSLTKEWFLVVSHPRYHRALVAQEVTPLGTPHQQRLFRGVLTSDKDQVERLSHALEEALKKT
jgi:DICT domain-containing protein